MIITGNLIKPATAGSAGFDLRSNETGFDLMPGERTLVATGTRILLEPGTVGFICPRSGMAAKYGITVLNAPGIIDSDYTGELKVVLVNLGDTPYHINPGDRIAQLVVLKYSNSYIHVSENDFNISVEDRETSRGVAGFGSTGNE